MQCFLASALGWGAIEGTRRRRRGHMHYNGDGVAQSFEGAIKWTQLAADQGHAQSQYNLGWMYSIRWTMKARVGKGLPCPLHMGRG